MKLFAFLYGVTMGMFNLNYTENLPDGGLLIDMVKEQVRESLVVL